MMKKLGLVAILGAFLALPAVVEAQGQDDATANISVTVLEALSLTATDLEFDDILQGEPATTINWDDPGAAEFVASGQADADIQVTVPEVTALLHVDDNTIELPFVQQFWGANNGDGTGAAALGDGDHTVTLNDSDGEYFFWLGGTVTPAAEQEPGAYSAEFTVAIEYVD